jgi:transcription elongation GreA/GreB family factor
MNKRLLLKAILAALEAEVQTFVRAVKSAHAEATDPQSRAENKYDTRGLEASYLAAGQARQVRELEAAVAAFTSLVPQKFAAGDSIGPGALVELEQGGTHNHYFIGPCAGGTEAVVGRKTVLVITPQSPLGGQLQGRKQGERLDLLLGGTKRPATIVAVS